MDNFNLYDETLQLRWESGFSEVIQLFNTRNSANYVLAEFDASRWDYWQYRLTR